MKLQIQIETGEDCLFKLLDTTQYLEGPNDFGYLDTESIVIVALHNSKSNNLEYLPLQFIKHRDLETKETITTEFNGFFNFSYVVLPTKQWVVSHNIQSKIYYIDNNKVYKLLGENSIEVSSKELAETDIHGTTISRVSQLLVSICNLKREFVEICSKIYQSRSIKSCSYKGCVNKELIHLRDLLWTFINLISYYTANGEYYEALRLIELIDICYLKEHIDLNKCSCNGLKN